MSTGIPRQWKRFVVVGLVAAMVPLSGCSGNTEQQKQESLRKAKDFADQKKFHEAIIEYQNALKADPSSGAAQAGLGVAYHEIGDHQHAANAVARAADLLPDDTDLQIRAGSMRLLSRDFED